MSQASLIRTKLLAALDIFRRGATSPEELEEAKELEEFLLAKPVPAQATQYATSRTKPAKACKGGAQ
jgi:hypothetical protein